MLHNMINAPTITWQSLQLSELIGNGSFGDVYYGRWNGRNVAIKTLQMKTLAPHLDADFKKEATMMWQCQSPYTVTLHGICSEPGHYAMVMEHMFYGSLYQLIHDPTKELSWELRWQIAIDIAEGLAYLHSKEILHRDLKSFNILLDHNYCAKISDFGLAKLKLESSSSTAVRHKSHSVGTVRWRAPELFKRGGTTTTATDVYSYGMILWEILTGKLPFGDAQDEITVMGWVKDGEKEAIPEDCPLAWKQIIESCWAEPTARPSAKSIIMALIQARPQVQPVATLPKAWHFDPSIKPAPEQVQGYALLPATSMDFSKVLEYYEHHPVSGYTIGSVKVIYNPNMNRSFALNMNLLQARANNPAFSPKWNYENHATWRSMISTTWEALARPYQDSDLPGVKLMPLWHGTRPEILNSLLVTGYANLATTDAGYFGKGIYGTHEAEYAYRVYSDGALILNWVATFSAYPVTKEDMPKLVTKGNYQNYDAHFALVAPNDPSNPQETVYYPCDPNQPHQYTEVVVFEKAQCLPRYLVTLQATLLKHPAPKPNPLLWQFQKQKEQLIITEEGARDLLQLESEQSRKAIFNQFEAILQDESTIKSLKEEVLLLIELNAGIQNELKKQSLIITHLESTLSVEALSKHLERYKEQETNKKSSRIKIETQSTQQRIHQNQEIKRLEEKKQTLLGNNMELQYLMQLSTYKITTLTVSNLKQFEKQQEQLIITQKDARDLLQSESEQSRKAIFNQFEAIRSRVLAEKQEKLRLFEAYWEDHRSEFPAGFMPRRNGIPAGWIPPAGWVPPLHLRRLAF